MNKLKIFITLLSLVIFSFGSVSAKTNEYGALYDDTIPLKPISYITDSNDINGKILSFKGKIAAQCENDGCWLKLKDDTSIVLIDLKPSGFRLPSGMVGKKIKLNGYVNLNDGKVKVDANSIIVYD